MERLSHSDVLILTQRTYLAPLSFGHLVPISALAHKLNMYLFTSLISVFPLFLHWFIISFSPFISSFHGFSSTPPLSSQSVNHSIKADVHPIMTEASRQTRMRRCIGVEWLDKWWYSVSQGENDTGRGEKRFCVFKMGSGLQLSFSCFSESVWVIIHLLKIDSFNPSRPTVHNPLIYSL